MVNAWIQMWGEEKAWAFMDKLHENIASYSPQSQKIPNACWPSPTPPRSRAGCLGRAHRALRLPTLG